MRQALRPAASEAFPPSLVDAVEQPLAVLDTRMKVVAWNVAMEGLSGVKRADALGRDAAKALPFLVASGLAVHSRRALAGEAAASGEVLYTIAAPARRGWLEARYLPWRDAAGRVGGALVFVADVTEHRRRAQFLRAIETIGHSLTTLDLDEVLDTIVTKALEVMGAESALVASWDGRAPAVTVMRAAGRLSREYAEAGVIPVGGGPLSRAVIEARPVTVGNILSDPQTWLGPERRARVEREGYKAVAAAPLISKDRVHGALVVHYWVERTFSEEDVAALTLLAEHAAIAIDNARLYADATRRADRLRELAEVEQLVAASLDLGDVLRRIAEATARLVNSPVVQVWIADPAAGALRLRAASADPGVHDPTMPTTIEYGEGISGRVAAEKQPIYVDDVGEDTRALSRQWARASGIQKMLAVPILWGDELLGVLSVRARDDSLSNDENRMLVTTFAAHAGVAIRNASLYQAERGQAARIRALTTVNRRISGTLELDELLRTIAESAAELTGVRYVAFWLADEARRTLTLWGGSAAEMTADYPVRVLSYDAGGSGWVARHRVPLVADDAPGDDRIANPEWWRRWQLTSVALYPVFAGDRLLAVLTFCHTEPIRFAADTRDVVEIFIAQASVALQNARLYREAQHRREIAEALARLGRELASTLDAARITELVTRGVSDLLGVRGSAVYRHDPEDGTLHAIAAFGIDAGPMQEFVFQPGEGIVGRAVAERKIVATTDIAHDPTVEFRPALRARMDALGYRAVLGIPLVAQERVIGALGLSAEGGREFPPDELQTLQSFADQAALALETARLYASAQDSLARLRDTQAQLVQAAKLSALGQLVSGVAHELNNPLSVIIGYGQLLMAREVPPQLRRPIELMVGQADRMAKIVRNLLFFARQRPPGRAAVSLNEVIEQTLALRANHLALSGITVEKAFTDPLPAIAGDSQQLEQVVLNLLLNAEQAILDAKQGSRILLRTGVRPSGGAVFAEVVDDGPGIPPDALSHVFEPFFTTKTVGTGTGLGLSVSYGIVEEHRGTLGVRSRPGETVFTIEFPVARATDFRPEPAAAPAAPLTVDGRIALVVEDEPSVLDLVVTLLGHTGWRVDVAAGGHAGLERVRGRRYDLIVTDMRMPEGGGEEFYRSAVAEDPTLAGRFIFITGDTANAEAWAFLHGTSAPVIEKPFQPALFLDAVRRVTTSLTA